MIYIWRQRTIKMLTMSLLTLLMIEASLRLFDPLGVNTYYSWLAFNTNERNPHVTGYSHPEDVYIVAGDTVTIDEAGNRALPHREDPHCTVGLIGDSVTFGMGVSDDETFAYRLAEALPDVQMINAAKGGYDSLNIALSAIDTDADFYVYVIVRNDATAPTWYYPQHFDNTWASRNHLHYFRNRNKAYPHENGLYTQTLDVLHYFDVLYVALDDNVPAGIAQQRVDVLILPEIERISIADQHPTAQGHETIAGAILPHLNTRLREHC